MNVVHLRCGALSHMVLEYVPEKTPAGRFSILSVDEGSVS